MLVESTKKREQLENMVRGKLEAEVKKLHDQVKLLNGKSIFHVTLLQREEFFFFWLSCTVACEWCVTW